MRKIFFAVGSNVFVFFAYLFGDSAIFGNHYTPFALRFGSFSYFVLPGVLFFSVAILSFILFFKDESNGLRLKLGRTLMFTQICTLPLFLAGYLSHFFDMKDTDNFYSIYLLT